MPTKQRPYLLRAMHEWMVDNGFTPHLVVDARRDGVEVPEEHVQDGKIVLNVSHSATQGLSLGNEVVIFETRFGGVPRRLEIPIAAVLGIYARETGQGMIFGEDDPPPGANPTSTRTPPTAPSPKPSGTDPRKPPSKPKLKVVK
jgi:stringent starvation protein B